MAFNANEKVSITIDIQGDEARNRLVVLEREAKNLEKALKEVPKGSKEWAELNKQFNANAKAQDDLRKKIGLTGLTLKQLETEQKKLTKELKNMTAGTQEFINKSKQLQEVNSRITTVRTQMTGLDSAIAKLPKGMQGFATGVKTVATAFQAFMALQAVMFIVQMGKAIFDITAKFEKYQTVLTTALGSEKQARQSMEAIKVMAAQTVFGVDELTEGYVKMVNRGLRPSQKEMTALADLAASQGKTFDQLVEAVLDAMGAEFERLKEFGAKGKKAGETLELTFKQVPYVIKNTGEEFQILEKKTGKLIDKFSSQEDAVMGVMTAFGRLEGVQGQNAKMAETLSGKASNLSDSFDSLMVELGTGLRPVFVAIMELISKSIPLMSFLGKAIGTVVLAAKGLVMGIVESVTAGWKVLTSLYDAGKMLLSGNLDGAKAAMKTAADYGTQMVTATAKSSLQAGKEIIAMWDSKDAEVKAEFAGKTQGQKFQKELTKEQEKAQKEREKKNREHQEEVKKDNAKALELLEQLNSEHDQAVANTSLQKEEEKINEKRRKRLKEINDSLADEKNKEKVRDAINKAADAEIDRAKAEFRKKQQEADEKAAVRRAEAERYVIDQTRKAEMALLDWKEVAAKGNTTKLTAVAKERADVELRITKERLNAERKEEEAKAQRDIDDEKQLQAALAAIKSRYNNEEKLAEQKHATDLKKIDEDMIEAKKKRRQSFSDMFSSLLKGDVTAFMNAADGIVKGEQEAWQKKLQANQQGFEQIGQMAMQAAQFLADVAKRRADKAIAEAARERDEKLAIINEGLEKEKAEIERIEAEKQKVKDESERKIQEIKSQSEQSISALEAQYRQLTSVENKSALDAQLQSYKDNADEKATEAKANADSLIQTAQEEKEAQVEFIKQKKEEAIDAAKNEKQEKIDAAEAARDAEIAAINNRADVDTATKQRLIAEAKAKFETEKELAESEAKAKIDLATSEAKTKIELANDTFTQKKELAELQRDSELKAIDEVKRGDLAAAKETMAKAKQDAAEKIRLAKDEAKQKLATAEQDKRDRLKVLEQEKQSRLQSQKALNNSAAAEEKRYRDQERNEKRKAWQAQKKADIATALITGALSVLKALANVFPLNLVFAALAAVMTGVQIAKIKSQPEPQFAMGGMAPVAGVGGVPSGSKHGRHYGEGGISLIDNRTGENVGEMEGGEAIISADQTEANMPLIQQMFQNARHPIHRKKPVDRPMMRNGGLFESPYWKKDSYLFGSKKKKQAEEEARKAEQEAAAAQAEAGDYGSGDYSGGDYGGDVEGAAEAGSSHAEAKKMGQDQIQLLKDIKDEIKALSGTQKLVGMALSSGLQDVKGAVGGVQSAVNEVKDAVNAGNQSGRLDALLGSISAFGKK